MQSKIQSEAPDGTKQDLISSGPSCRLQETRPNS